MKRVYWALPLALLLAACKNDKPQNGSTIFGNGDGESTELVNEEGETEDLPAEQPNKGHQYTDLTMPTLQGEMKSLSYYVKQNKVTVIDCWASWCRPCIEEMPNIARLYRKYHDLGVGVVGVSFDSDPRAWNTAVKMHDMVWPQLGELNGWNNQMSHVYGVKGIPHTIIINRKGEIVAEGLRGEALINAVAKEL